MKSVSDLELPYLPASGYSPLQLQIWWQDVVDRLSAAVASINEGAGDVSAAEERDAAMLAQIMALGAAVAALRGLGDAIAQLTSENAELRGRLDQLRQRINYVEELAWQP